MARDVVLTLGCSPDCTYSKSKTVPLTPGEANVLTEQATGGVWDPNGFEVPIRVASAGRASKLSLKVERIMRRRGLDGECQPGDGVCPYAPQLSEFTGQLAINGLLERDSEDSGIDRSRLKFGM